MKPGSTRVTQRRVTPTGWPARMKSYVNTLTERVFRKRLFKLDIHDMFGSSPEWQQRVTRLWRDLRGSNLPFTLGLLATCVLILAAWHALAPQSFPNARVEFVGPIYDIFFILLVFALFQHRRQRTLDIRRQQEIIDDYKKWDSDEARFRIAGAVRRLVLMGKTDIDFGGLELRDFSLQRHDIRSLRGSLFYDGTWGEAGSRDRVVLRNVDFTQVNCRSVTFSKFNPFGGFGIDVVFASFVDCSFVYADLEGADFRGAHVEWTKVPPEEVGEWEELADGPASFHQTYYPPFHQANLAGASFRDVRFKNADFREAESVLECDFAGAKGLDTALFDDEDTKKAVLALAGEPDTRAPQQ